MLRATVLKTGRIPLVGRGAICQAFATDGKKGADGKGPEIKLGTKITMAKTNPSTAQPSGSTTAQPSGSTTAQPSGSTAAQPSGSTTQGSSSGGGGKSGGGGVFRVFGALVLVSTPLATVLVMMERDKSFRQQVEMTWPAPLAVMLTRLHGAGHRAFDAAYSSNPKPRFDNLSKPPAEPLQPKPVEPKPVEPKPVEPAPAPEPEPLQETSEEQLAEQKIISAMKNEISAVIADEQAAEAEDSKIVGDEPAASVVHSNASAAADSSTAAAEIPTAVAGPETIEIQPAVVRIPESIDRLDIEVPKMNAKLTREDEQHLEFRAASAATTEALVSAGDALLRAASASRPEQDSSDELSRLVGRAAVDVDGPQTERLVAELQQLLAVLRQNQASDISTAVDAYKRACQEQLRLAQENIEADWRRQQIDIHMLYAQRVSDALLEQEVLFKQNTEQYKRQFRAEITADVEDEVRKLQNNYQGQLDRYQEAQLDKLQALEAQALAQRQVFAERARWQHESYIKHHLSAVVMAMNGVLAERKPFVSELKALQACGGKDPVIAAAVEQLSAEEANTGVYTMPQLLDRFQLVSMMGQRAVYTPQGGVFSQAVGFVLSKLPLMKEEGLPSGKTDDAAFRRCEYYLQLGQLHNAIDEIDQLPVAAAKQLANDWLEEAKKRERLQQVLRVLEGYVMQHCISRF